MPEATLTTFPAPDLGAVIRTRDTGAIAAFVRAYIEPDTGRPVWVVHHDGDPVNWAGSPGQFELVTIDTVTDALRSAGVQPNVWRHNPRHRWDRCTYNHQGGLGPDATCTVYRRTGQSVAVCLGCLVLAVDTAIEDAQGRFDTVTAEVCKVDDQPPPAHLLEPRPEIHYPPHRGAGRTEYRVTFGFGHIPHPRLPEAHHDGWLTVVAADELAARVATIARIGTRWSFIYGPTDIHYPTEQHYPRGELYRIVVGATTTDAAPGARA